MFIMLWNRGLMHQRWIFELSLPESTSLNPVINIFSLLIELGQFGMRWSYLQLRRRAVEWGGSARTGRVPCRDGRALGSVVSTADGWPHSRFLRPSASPRSSRQLRATWPVWRSAVARERCEVATDWFVQSLWRRATWQASVQPQRHCCRLQQVPHS